MTDRQSIYAERGDFDRQVWLLIQETQAKVAALMERDLRHQLGPRGVGTEKALEITLETFNGAVTGAVDAARQDVIYRLSEEGVLRPY